MGRFAPDSWTPAVNVTTWFLLVTAILSVLTRLGTKYRIFRRWTVDDYLSIASLVGSCGNMSLFHPCTDRNRCSARHSRSPFRWPLRMDTASITGS